ncbi:MAG TPA: ABC transporter permease [Balneolaceae bacterium]
MFRNYIKVAWRNLVRKKKYSLINIVGLALGIACCILLFLYVHNEWTYDEFHQKADRIFRVNRLLTEPNGDVGPTADTPAPLAAALKNTFPEVQKTVRLTAGDIRIAIDNNSYVKKEALYVDGSFFEVFTFHLLKGNPKEALTAPNGIVISKEFSQKYFSNSNPVGQSVSVKIEDEEINLQVTGVVENIPTNSSMQFNVLLPLKTVKHSWPDSFRRLIFSSWQFPLGETFVLLNKKTKSKELKLKLTDFAEQHFGEEAEKVGLSLQPLTAIHHQTGISGSALSPPANPVYAYIMLFIALLVLFTACINFTTLSLGQSKSRSKEVGVRKVMGAGRMQIRTQFWAEAVLTAGAAVVVGITLAQAFLPTFNNLAGTNLTLRLTLEMTSFLLLLIIGVGLIAGSYPALILSLFKPSRILSKKSTTGKSYHITQSLVVIQFALSIALIIGTLIMSAQLNFMKKNLGFNQQQVIEISGLGSTNEGQQILESYRQEISRHEAVQEVAGASFGFWGQGLEAQIELSDTERLQVQTIPVSENFLETLEIRLKQGRSFSSQRAVNGLPVIVNEALVNAMGWTTAVEKNLILTGNSLLNQAADRLQIIGVTENFHNRPLSYEIAPTILIPSKTFGGVSDIYVRIKASDIPNTLNFLRKTWSEVAPKRLFQYQFLDEVVEQAYRTEQRWKTIIRYAAGFALLITSFGLFGLSMLATERRTKEIGIRKVMGATISNIVGLLSKDFLKLVLIGFVIAVPIAWYFMNQWLQDFAYRIEIGVGIFLLAGALALLIALATVSWQSIRAALANPVDSLRSE